MAMPTRSSNESGPRSVRLTPAEYRVLKLIAEGHTSQQAADLLVCNKRTVDFHLANIYEKLEVHNRVQAIRAAARLGLIPFDPVFGSNDSQA